MSKEYYRKNKEKILAKQEKYYIANRAQRIAKMAEYYTNHKEEQAVRMANYYIKHKTELVSKSVAHKKKKRIENTQTRIAELLRARMYKATRYDYRAGSAVRDLGCSMAQFKLYIENQFEPGMSWNNQGKWQTENLT